MWRWVSDAKFSIGWFLMVQHAVLMKMHDYHFDFMMRLVICLGSRLELSTQMASTHISCNNTLLNLSSLVINQSTSVNLNYLHTDKEGYTPLEIISRINQMFVSCFVFMPSIRASSLFVVYLLHLSFWIQFQLYNYSELQLQQFTILNFD